MLFVLMTRPVTCLSRAQQLITVIYGQRLKVESYLSLHDTILSQLGTEI